MSFSPEQEKWILDTLKSLTEHMPTIPSFNEWQARENEKRKLCDGCIIQINSSGSFYIRRTHIDSTFTIFPMNFNFDSINDIFGKPDVYYENSFPRYFEDDILFSLDSSFGRDNWHVYKPVADGWVKQE